MKIIKELGSGIIGTVYLVSKNGKPFALKIEHLLEEDLYDPHSPFWNEARFVKEVAKKHPMQFMQWLDFDLIEPCTHQQVYPVDLEVFPPNKQKYLLKLASSPLCVKKLYSFVDQTLNQIQLISQEEYKSMVIQLLYIYHLMESKGYVHGDFHSGNIGVIPTQKKYIKILGKKVPTKGRLFQAIDYGSVLNKNTLDPKKKVLGLEETQQDIFNWALVEDKMTILRQLIDDDAFWNYVDENQIPVMQMGEQLEKLSSVTEYQQLDQFLHHDSLKLLFFKWMYPELYQKMMLGSSFDHVRIPKIHMPMEDILFFFINFDHTKVLLNYFLK